MNRTQGDIYLEARNRYLSYEINKAELFAEYVDTGLLAEDEAWGIVYDRPDINEVQNET